MVCSIGIGCVCGWLVPLICLFGLWFGVGYGLYLYPNDEVVLSLYRLLRWVSVLSGVVMVV